MKKPVNAPAIVPQFKNTAKGKKAKLACLHNAHNRIARHSGLSWRFVVQHLKDKVLVTAEAITGQKQVVNLDDASPTATALRTLAENRLYS
jgi:hypothetical protein